MSIFMHARSEGSGDLFDLILYVPVEKISVMSRCVFLG